MENADINLSQKAFAMDIRVIFWLLSPFQKAFTKEILARHYWVVNNYHVLVVWEFFSAITSKQSLSFPNCLMSQTGSLFFINRLLWIRIMGF